VRTNRITMLQDDGSMCTEQEELEALTKDFYVKLFTAQVETEPRVITDHVPMVVTEAMNETLNTPFTADEVEQALFMMGANKAPGPDDFSAGFYQRRWDLLKEDVRNAVLDFLNGEGMPSVVNSAILILIPKIKQPQEMTHFQPISLCGVLYKLLPKLDNKGKMGACTVKLDMSKHMTELNGLIYQL
jgi:hypothetical protein